MPSNNISNSDNSTAPVFASDWFSNNIPIWDNYKPMFFNQPNMRCLEIGSFEGRSTIYTAENYCNGNGSYIDAVDTWEGSIEHDDEYKVDLYDRFVNNVQEYIDNKKVHLYRDYSSNTLMKFVQEVRSGIRDKYSFIYIDASHVAKDVLMDTVLSWELLRINGVMIFDDYLWYEYYRDDSIASMTPKPAIDGFLASYTGMYETLHKDHQVHILKTKDHPRINDILYSAIIKNDVEEVKNALVKGADINYIHPIGATALYMAVQKNSLEVVKMLLDNNARINIKAVNNLTPLYMSVQNQNYNMTKLLLEHEADTEVSLSSGSTSLYLAAYFGYNDIAKLLLEYGANKNIEVANITAFQRAIQNQHYDTAELLADDIATFCQAIPAIEAQTNFVDVCGKLILQVDA